MTQSVKQTRVEFSSELPLELMDALTTIARADGSDLQTLLEDAVRRYLEGRAGARAHVLDALDASMAEHDDLYKALAR